MTQKNSATPEGSAAIDDSYYIATFGDHQAWISKQGVSLKGYRGPGSRKKASTEAANDSNFWIEFKGQLEADGFELRGQLEESRIVRCKVTDDQGRTSDGLDGWYVFNQTPLACWGVYGDWRYDSKIVWSNRSFSSMTANERQEIETQIKQAKEEQAEKRRLEQDQAAIKAAEAVNDSSPADKAHPYLVRKQIAPCGVLEKDGNLIIPIRNVAGQIRSYQTIYAEEKQNKRYQKGGQIQGCFYLMGEGYTTPTYMAEGFATAATIRSLTGKSVIVAFDAGNLLHVAKAIRQAGHQQKILICADNDRHKEAEGKGNTGVKKARETAAIAVGVEVVIPEFSQSEGTDFNDLAVIEGEEAAKTLLYSASQAAALPIDTIPEDFDLNAIPPRKWVAKGFIESGKITAVLAPGGTGKSSYLLALAVSCALGQDLLGLGVCNQTNMLLVNNEDDKDEINRRLGGIFIHYNINPADLNGRLFLGYGYGRSIKVMERFDTFGLTPSSDVACLTTYLSDRQIGVAVFDPFISTHEASENKNDEMDKVLEQFRIIAKDTGAAVVLSHHTRKGGKDSEADAGDVESSRGAKSLTDGCRAVLTLARMNEETARHWGITPDLRSRLVRIDGAKANNSLMDDEPRWLKMVTVLLPNGDEVGVPEPFDTSPYKAAMDQSKERRGINVYEDTLPELEPLLRDQPDPSRVYVNDIVDLFGARIGHGDGTARKRINLLSNNEKKPTRYRAPTGEYIDYWLEREGSKSRGPQVIHRKEL